jgi:hypothetical protein
MAARRFPRCFLSCSLQDVDRSVLEWFAAVLEALDFSVSRGDDPLARPPPVKVRDLIREADVVVAVLTRRDKVEGDEVWRPPEWIQNELGMAYDAGKPIAVFVEAGVRAEGLAPLVTQYEEFVRTDLGAAAPRVVRYLVSLRGAVSAQPPPEDAASIAKALAVELDNRGAEVAVVDQTLDLHPWNLSFLYVRVTGKMFLLPVDVQNKVEAAYEAIQEALELVREARSIQLRAGWRLLAKPPGDPARKEEIVAELAKAKPRILGSIEAAVAALLEFAWPGIMDRLREARKAALPPASGGDGNTPGSAAVSHEGPP